MLPVSPFPTVPSSVFSYGNLDLTQSKIAKVVLIVFATLSIAFLSLLSLAYFSDEKSTEDVYNNQLLMANQVASTIGLFLDTPSGQTTPPLCLGREDEIGQVRRLLEENTWAVIKGPYFAGKKTIVKKIAHEESTVQNSNELKERHLMIKGCDLSVSGEALLHKNYSYDILNLFSQKNKYVLYLTDVNDMAILSHVLRRVINRKNKCIITTNLELSQISSSIDVKALSNQDSLCTLLLSTVSNFPHLQISQENINLVLTRCCQLQPGMYLLPLAISVLSSLNSTKIAINQDNIDTLLLKLQTSTEISKLPQRLSAMRLADSECFARDSSIHEAIAFLNHGCNIAVVAPPFSGKKHFIKSLAATLQKNDLKNPSANKFPLFKVRSFYTLDLKSLKTSDNPTRAIQDLLTNCGTLKNVILVIFNPETDTEKKTYGYKPPFHILCESLVSESFRTNVQMVVTTTEKGLIDLNTIEFERSFKQVKLPSLSFEDVTQGLERTQSSLEKKLGVKIPEDVFKKTIDFCRTHLSPERPLLSWVLEILSSAALKTKKDDAISVSTVYELITQRCGYFVGIPSDDKRELIRQFPDKLKKLIVGQDNAIDEVSRILSINLLGLLEREGPLCKLFLAGPTGVGKTEVAKQVAQSFQNLLGLEKNSLGDSNFCIIPMAQYREPHSFAGLIGPPPGYVGYEDKGILVNFAQKFPNGIIVFDEIEKAHRDSHQLLLQLLSEGYMMDTAGHPISFKGMIICFTSNVGSDLERIDSSLSPEDFYKQLKQNVMTGLGRAFTPEFFNRISNSIVVFQPLNLEAAEHLFDLELEKIQKHLSNQKITLSIDPSIKKFICQFYNPKTGFRGFRTVVREKIIHPVAQAILNLEQNKTEKQGFVVHLHLREKDLIANIKFVS